MIDEKLDSIVREMNQLGVIISFNGSFTQKIIEEIGDAIKNYVEQDKTEDIDEKKSYDIFSIYIEQSQNMKNYFYKKVNYDRENEFLKLAFESIIVIGKEKNQYYVCSGNIIDNNDIKELTEKIEHVNSLDKDQLRKYYKERLRKSRSNDLGAGLGFIDMARKSSGPLKHLIIERDQHHSFFILRVNI